MRGRWGERGTHRRKEERVMHLYKMGTDSMIWIRSSYGSDMSGTSGCTTCLALVPTRVWIGTTMTSAAFSTERDMVGFLHIVLVLFRNVFMIGKVPILNCEVKVRFKMG